MQPLPISPETAIKLADHLKVPIEHVMHMPRHILLQKLAELARAEQAQADQAQSDPDQSDPTRSVQDRGSAAQDKDN